MCRYSDPAISWNLQGQNFISRTCNPTLFRKHIWCIGECKSRARGRCWNSISVHYICMKPPLKLISFPESFLLDTCCFARKLLLWCTSCYLFHRMTHMTGYGTSGMTWPDLNDDSCGQAIRWKIFWAFETFGYISISSCHTIVCSICQFWILGIYIEAYGKDVPSSRSKCTFWEANTFYEKHVHRWLRSTRPLSGLELWLCLPHRQRKAQKANPASMPTYAWLHKSACPPH